MRIIESFGINLAIQRERRPEPTPVYTHEKIIRHAGIKPNNQWVEVIGLGKYQRRETIGRFEKIQNVGKRLIVLLKSLDIINGGVKNSHNKADHSGESNRVPYCKNP